MLNIMANTHPNSSWLAVFFLWGIDDTTWGAKGCDCNSWTSGIFHDDSGSFSSGIFRWFWEMFAVWGNMIKRFFHMFHHIFRSITIVCIFKIISPIEWILFSTSNIFTIDYWIGTWFEWSVDSWFTQMSKTEELPLHIDSWWHLVEPPQGSLEKIAIVFLKSWKNEISDLEGK